MTAEAPPDERNDDAHRPAPSRRASVLWAVVLMGCATLAWAMTGPPPKSGQPAERSDPPPFVVRESMPRTGLEYDAASALQEGRWREAASLFDRAATERPDDPVPAVGLVIARWNASGADAAIEALDAIGRQYPDDQWVALHRGLARLMASRPDAQRVLTKVRSAAQLNAQWFDIARRADDLLHPNAAPGYPPLLVRGQDLGTPDERAAVERISASIAADDRRGASRAATELARARSRSTLARVAIEVGRFSKDRPLQSSAALAQIRDRAPAGPDQAGAALHHALVVIWVSGPERALPELRAVAQRTDGGRWSVQARELVRSLDGVSARRKP